ncbi:ASB17 [Mytilus edulis]|uniref:ASB17 n=1 Tax=Mytilus edulis TaxID=6550 RepID=A0A8S3V8X4_MYTED|nr:ASB17 [Mytilus edulis]
MKIFEGNKYSFTNKKDVQCPAEKFLYRQQLGNTLSDVMHNHKSDIVSKIREVANIHKYRRRLKGKCIEHDSLYMSLRLCFEYEINEKELAQNLLLEMFICEGNLDTIFSILLPGHVIKTLSSVKRYTNLLYPGFMSKTMRKKLVESFHFYLRQICETREKLTNGECDIIDRPFEITELHNPLSAAAVCRDPEMVEVLVEDALTEEGRRGLICLDTFMRGVWSVSFDASTHINTLENGDDSDKKLEEQKSYGLNPKLADMFDYKHYMGVRSLQHVCRCSIRTTLSKNSPTLPSEIEKLPLPPSIKAYLDLKSN